MINRELIRIKIVQLTYAYYQNGNRNLDVAEKELLFSLSNPRDFRVSVLYYLCHACFQQTCGLKYKL